MDNLEIYNKARSVPDSAQKKIAAGRLRGFTDINPMWRLEKLTEIFGPCGLGWFTDDIRHWLEDGSDGTKTAHVALNLYVKKDGEWSKPIFGIGGASYISNEKGGAYTSDECFKMAYTDALSVACKALGFGADVYWAAGRSKYRAVADVPVAEKSKTEKAIDSINKLAKELADSGVAKKAISDTIKSVSGSANYNKITDFEVATDVYKELVALRNKED